jgi:hypothetical protein
MGITAAIIGAISVITTVLGVLNILEVTSTPILSDKLTWTFWFACSALLLLGSIALMLGRKNTMD